VAHFVDELLRMKLVEGKFQAVPPGGLQDRVSLADQAASAETTDLSAALRKAKLGRDERQKILDAHRAVREQLKKFLADTEVWENSRPRVFDEKGMHWGKPQVPPPGFPAIPPIEGLPNEFSGYLEGAIAWHNPAVIDKGMARSAWERLLSRPAQERRFKSTWAAFMLGKSWEEGDPDKATKYFSQVRSLARSGFADPVGLAAASFGLEARVYLRQKKYEPAIEMYLEQLATEDPTAAASLAFTAAAALKEGPSVLRPLAKNPRTQRALTAFLISQRSERWRSGTADEIGQSDQPRREANPAKAWLEAVEAAGVKDLESAEKLALAAYQNNEMALAQRWINRAPNSPGAQWLQAKLLLRAGKLNQAAALLAKVTACLPVQPPGTNSLAKAQFAELLSVEGGRDQVPAPRQALGELGALRLTRREYTEALDALLNAGFWMDAAYVAERVLTLDELKTYVDRSWPLVPPEQLAEERAKYGSSEASPVLLREQIRYLLARRLVRSMRGDDAREYYPAEWVPQFDALSQALKTGWDESLPPEQRARALFKAAIITRTNGMELIGTEVEPDWHFHSGDFEEGVTASWRATNETARVLVASQDEVRRSAQHRADPEERFHYRYQAASLAWEAAKLLPDNSDETAHVLWAGGWWLKNRDAQTADIFYKALVRRNRKTALGAEADRIRWFPRLDEQGNLIPRGPSRLETMRPAVLAERTGGESTETVPGEFAQEYPFPGKFYVVHYGDELRDIAQAASVFGQPVTMRDILAANPGLDPSRCRVGQKIMIPDLKLNNPEPVPNAPANPPAPESPDSRPISAPDSPP
jgi:tetratricopeptide (TPR) repeat protein